jgi:hypothetical protein
LSDNSDKKRISINTDLLSPTKNKKAKTLKKKKIVPPVKVNSIKKALINKIKQKQQLNETKPTSNSENVSADSKLGISEDDFENDFMKSMQFLDTMIKEKKSDREKKRTLKKNSYNNVQAQAPIMQAPAPTMQAHAPTMQAPAPTMQAPAPTMQAPAPTMQAPAPTMQAPARVIPLQPDPKYGCLKNGSKPCYRSFHNKTLKKNVNTYSQSRKPNKTKIHKRIIKKRKYKVGKTAKNRTISVLIKNTQTRRRVQQDLTSLKQKPISEIKKELYKKNLLKIGTVCPPDVIRTIYEHSMLAGNIVNTGKGVSIHNFISEDD